MSYPTRKCVRQVFIFEVFKVNFSQIGISRYRIVSRFEPRVFHGVLRLFRLFTVTSNITGAHTATATAWAAAIVSVCRRLVEAVQDFGGRGVYSKVVGVRGRRVAKGVAGGHVGVGVGLLEGINVEAEDARTIIATVASIDYYPS